MGVFPQTEAVWALGKEDLCVHFTPSPREGDTKPHGGHQDFRWPHTRGTATSSFPKPQPLCIDSGCRIRCDPTRHRLETCRDALAQTTSLLGFGFLAPSARPHHRGSMFTCHVHPAPGCSPVLHDQPSYLHSLHLSSPSQNIFYPHQL